MLGENKIWLLKPPPRDLLYYFLREGGFTPLASQILINKGFQSIESAYAFLFPRLSDLADPFEIPNMNKAVERIAEAVSKGERIGIYGDSDVDGVFGSYILYDFLSKITDRTPFVCIPDKNSEGYGFHAKYLPLFKEEGVKLLLTVDVGISAKDTVRQAKELGLEVIITDHHEIGSLPETLVVTGKLCPQDSPFYFLSGTGVAFTLVRALRSYLFHRNFFGNLAPPNLKKYLELVAIATLADMVPLVGENRILTYFGFRELADPNHPLLKILIKGLGLKSPLSEEDLNFKIIPRLNTLGRMGRGQELFNLLAEIHRYGEQAFYIIEELYSQRQELESEIWDRIDRALQIDPQEPVICVILENIPRAMLGLFANRLRGKYGKPTLVMSIENGIAYGSGRSPEQIDFLDFLLEHRDLFCEIGGHKKAFGFQIPVVNLELLRERLKNLHILSQLKEQVLYLDAETRISELLLEENVQVLQALPPYGTCHDPPLIALKGFEVKSCEYLKERHTKFLLKEGSHEIFALYFNKICHRTIRLLVGAPIINSFSGKLEIRIEDVRL